MGDKEKPFGETDIVILLLISGISDIADLITDLIFLVPIIGQIVFLVNSMVVSPVIWAVIQLWFIMRTGAGRSSLVAALGGLGNIANIPGSETITTIIAIFMANSQKAGAVAGVATGALAGGAVAAEGAAARGAGAAGAAESGAASAEKAGTRAPAATGRTGASAGTEGGESAPPAEKAGTPESGISPEALGEEPEPIEKLQKEILGETPVPMPTENGEEGVYEDGNEIDLKNAR